MDQIDPMEGYEGIKVEMLAIKGKITEPGKSGDGESQESGDSDDDDSDDGSASKTKFMKSKTQREGIAFSQMNSKQPKLSTYKPKRKKPRTSHDHRFDLLNSKRLKRR